MFARVKYSFLFLLFSFTILVGSSAMAQSSGSASGADSVKATAPKQRKRDPGPRKATIMSAVVPGLGQIYNRKYWKLPIVYGLGGFLIYNIDQHQREYRKFSNAYNQRLVYLADPKEENKDPFFNEPDYRGRPDNLKFQRDDYKRLRDLNIIMLVGLYVLQIVDAHVDAHLKNFEINDNLSLNVTPQLRYLPQNNLYSGVSLNLKIKSRKESF